MSVVTSGPGEGPTKRVPLTRAVAPVRTQVADYLREMIADGTMQPGQRLVERTLCEMFGTSRSTVREAFRELEAERLVEVIPGRGPIVAAVSEKSIRDLYDVRQVLEQLAVSRFIERSSAADMAELEETFARLRVAYRAADVAAIIKEKRAFYAVLFRAADNDVVEDLVAKLYARIGCVRQLSLSRPGRAAEGLAELEEVMAAIRERDAGRAREAYRKHMENALAGTIVALRQQEAAVQAEIV